MPDTPEFPSMPDNRPTPVVLLHGAGMMPTMWQSQVEALGAERRAIAPWVAGLRPGRRFELSLRTASAEVIGTLDGSGYAKAALVAHQLGAMVALQAAADHPERIDRLVVSGATLLPGKLALRLQKAAIRVMPAARLAQTGATKDDLVKALDVMAEADFSQRLGEIVPPTLVIVGQGDAAGQASAKLLVAGLPNARLEIVPNSGANPSLENPQAYNALLIDFLAD
ncbi:MAG: alpha/beta hydrolase [Propionibacteriaceae bacterium]|nr:alpha/beta hydrolase [Propionibacteriaceae bacterium]